MRVKERKMASSSIVGCPSLQVNLEEDESMRKCGMSMTKISEIVGIRRSTLYRALEGSEWIGYTDNL